MPECHSKTSSRDYGKTNERIDKRPWVVAVGPWTRLEPESRRKRKGQFFKRPVATFCSRARYKPCWIGVLTGIFQNVILVAESEKKHSRRFNGDDSTMARDTLVARQRDEAAQQQFEKQACDKMVFCHQLFMPVGAMLAWCAHMYVLVACSCVHA